MTLRRNGREEMKLEKVDRFRCKYDEIDKFIGKYLELDMYLKYFLDDVWDRELNDYVIECVVDVYKPIRRKTFDY